MFHLIKYFLWQSGGHCMVDVFDGSSDSIAITDELVVYYTRTNCGYGDGTGEPCEGVILYDLTKYPATKNLQSNENGSVVSGHDYDSVTLLNGARFYFHELKAMALAKLNETQDINP